MTLRAVITGLALGFIPVRLTPIDLNVVRGGSNRVEIKEKAFKGELTVSIESAKLADVAVVERVPISPFAFEYQVAAGNGEGMRLNRDGAMMLRDQLLALLPPYDYPTPASDLVLEHDRLTWQATAPAPPRDG